MGLRWSMKVLCTSQSEVRMGWLGEFQSWLLKLPHHVSNVNIRPPALYGLMTQHRSAGLIHQDQCPKRNSMHLLLLDLKYVHISDKRLAHEASISQTELVTIRGRACLRYFMNLPSSPGHHEYYQQAA